MMKGRSPSSGSSIAPIAIAGRPLESWAMTS
jgi:hypothetical protein